MDFGEVQTGGQAKLQFLISNNGTDFCELSGVALSAASDPAFGLPDDPTGYGLLSPKGASVAQSPAGWLSPLPITVSYSPTQMAAASGAVGFTLGGVAHSVPLSGTTVGDCLVVTPALVDFGLVGLSQATLQACSASSAQILIANHCAQALDLAGLVVTPGVEPNPQFALLSSPPLPLLLSPGQTVGALLSFAPTSEGSHVEELLLSSDGGLRPSLVTLQGEAKLTGGRTDQFTVEPSKVDILWVMDTDDDVDGAQAVSGNSRR